MLPKSSGETESGRTGCWTSFGGSGSYNGFFEATSAWKHPELTTLAASCSTFVGA